jgi:hypothetical protein
MWLLNSSTHPVVHDMMVVDLYGCEIGERWEWTGRVAEKRHNEEGENHSMHRHDACEGLP